MKKQFVTVALALGLGLSTAIAGAQVGAVIRIGPPPARVERRPPPPVAHRDWVWQAGYNRWDGHAYVWVPGAYAAPPRPHARWVPGHYVRRRGGYVWIEGHWR